MKLTEKQLLFIALVKSQLNAEEQQYLAESMQQVSTLKKPSVFNVLFSTVSRFVTDETSDGISEKPEKYIQVYPAFKASSWTKQELVRVALMLSIDTKSNHEVLENLFEIAEIQEQKALYKGLYLLENAVSFKDRIKEGIRTNITDVFSAIADHNPYPYTYLEGDAWNQMILKALFLGRPLYTIYGIDKRRNKKLALMILDFIAERQAAGRPVTPEVWRLVSGYMSNRLKRDLESRKVKGIEKEAIDALLRKGTTADCDFWNNIGKRSTN